MRKQKVNKNGNYYCGLDLSLTGSGVVILNRHGVVVHAETLKNKFRGMPRLRFINDVIAETMHKYRPKEICIENYSMGSHSGQAFSIGELGGVIKLTLFSMDLPYHLVPPKRLKKFITGKGNSSKDEVMMHVYKRWEYEPADNNIADAYGLSQIARTLDKNNKVELSKPQLEVVKDILNPPEPKAKKKT